MVVTAESDVGRFSFTVVIVSLRQRDEKEERATQSSGGGVVISILGIALACMIVESVERSNRHQQHRIEKSRAAATVAKQRSSATKLVASAIAELAQYRRSHDGFLPSVIDSNMLVIKHTDPWGEELRFDLKKDHGVVRSAGPDMVFETPDDIVIRVKGKVQAEASLLPL